MQIENESAEFSRNTFLCLYSQMILSHQELIELTGRSRKDAQVCALRFMGIEHRLRPDGSVVVSRSHVERILSGQAADRLNKKIIEPNWSSI